MPINLHICIILVGPALSGCAIHHKTYSAPDAAKVNASEKRLSDAVTKATDAAARAQSHIEAAQKAADRAAAESASVINLTGQLAIQVPEHLRSEVAELRTAVDAQQSAEGELSVQLAGAYKDHGELRGHLEEANQAKAEALQARTEYQNEAGQLARRATEERDRRISAEKKLSWYRWHWWGSWIALGAGVIACGLFAFLKFTGRLALVTAKTAEKFAV
jgi:chromosome segregation ATPase